MPQEERSSTLNLTWLMGGCKIGFVTSLSAFYEILAAELGRKCFGRSDPSEYTVVGVERHFWDSGRF